MFRACSRQQCEHYALHVVRAHKHSDEIWCCHYHTRWAIAQIVSMTSKWARVSVTTHSAVVVGDVLAWRTRKLSAYEEFRQIGA